MDINQVILPPDVVAGIAMHCGSNGHNKDWIGFVTQSGHIHTAWGKPNQHYQTAVRMGNHANFDALVNEKIEKGYVTVDKCGPNGWASVAIKTVSQYLKSPKASSAMQVGKTAPKTVNITKGIKAPEEALSWDF